MNAEWPLVRVGQKGNALRVHFAVDGVVGPHCRQLRILLSGSG
jgi:hypothetical protein